MKYYIAHKQDSNRCENHICADCLNNKVPVDKLPCTECSQWFTNTKLCFFMPSFKKDEAND